MKYTVITMIALSLAFSAHAIDPKDALIAKLKEPMEKLNDLSIQMQKDQATQQLLENKLDELAAMYTTLIEKADDEQIRKKLEYTRQNFVECREMLDEDRQNIRFHFFNPGWNDHDDASDNQELTNEQRDETFFGGITQDLAGILSLLQ